MIICLVPSEYRSHKEQDLNPLTTHNQGALITMDNYENAPLNATTGWPRRSVLLSLIHI